MLHCLRSAFLKHSPSLAVLWWASVTNQMSMCMLLGLFSCPIYLAIPVPVLFHIINLECVQVFISNLNELQFPCIVWIHQVYWTAPTFPFGLFKPEILILVQLCELQTLQTNVVRYLYLWWLLHTSEPWRLVPADLPTGWVSFTNVPEATPQQACPVSLIHLWLAPNGLDKPSVLIKG